jgi:hypothetical protein
MTAATAKRLRRRGPTLRISALGRLRLPAGAGGVGVRVTRKPFAPSVPEMAAELLPAWGHGEYRRKRAPRSCKQSPQVGGATTLSRCSDFEKVVQNLWATVEPAAHTRATPLGPDRKKNACEPSGVSTKCKWLMCGRGGRWDKALAIFEIAHPATSVPRRSSPLALPPAPKFTDVRANSGQDGGRRGGLDILCPIRSQ